jgi:hypothetical protein
MYLLRCLTPPNPRAKLLLKEFVNFLGKTSPQQDGKRKLVETKGLAAVHL